MFGYTIPSNTLLELYLTNTITGDVIRPDTQGSEIDAEILRALSVMLYGWGMADLAVDPSNEIPDTPCERIMQVRLTPLGRYVLGIDHAYKAPASQQEGSFILDPERLIIQAMGKDNPYERLLLDTAEPIGHGLYRMTPESFLKHCDNERDVTEKIKFFNDYIDGNPPVVWREFFDGIRRRSKPLSKVQGSFFFFRLDAEDYRFLVGTKDYPRLVALLKQHSYLL